jgi:hypothetical protein
MALKYKVLIGIAVFGALVVTPAVTFLVMCSTDEPPHDDSDLRLTLPDVPDHLNAYVLLVEAGEKAYWPQDDATREKLDRMLGDGPWDAALARDVLGRNRETLALFEKAAARPHCRFPKVSLMDDMPGLYPCLTLSQVLVIRSKQEQLDGSPESAFETAIAQVRFGDRLARAKGPLVVHLVGLTVRGAGCERIRRLTARATLPPATWRDYADRLAALAPAPETLADAFRVEYGMVANLADGLRSGKYDPKEFAHSGMIPFLPYSLHANRTKHLLADAARKGIEATRQPYCDALPMLQAWSRSVHAGTLAARIPSELRPNGIGLALFRLISPNYESVMETRCHLAVSGAVTQAMLGLKAYKTRHGRLPQTLDDLVPEYLKAVPIDAFDGKPIRYDPAKRILYSVGKDGADGGGLSKEQQQAWWKREFPGEAEDDPVPNVSKMADPSYTIDF